MQSHSCMLYSSGGQIFFSPAPQIMQSMFREFCDSLPSSGAAAKQELRPTVQTVASAAAASASKVAESKQMAADVARLVFGHDDLGSTNSLRFVRLLASSDIQSVTFELCGSQVGGPVVV